MESSIDEFFRYFRNARANSLSPRGGTGTKGILIIFPAKSSSGILPQVATQHSRPRELSALARLRTKTPIPAPEGGNSEVTNKTGRGATNLPPEGRLAWQRHYRSSRWSAGQILK